MQLAITSYQDPDLDGTASAYAYAEFLRKTGSNAGAAIFGTPHQEAQYVMGRFNIPSFQRAEEIIGESEGIVLVDASTFTGLPEGIKLDKVVEIIDHRKINEAEKFSNAKVQIELVGAAATLIAEKFPANNIAITPESAALLYTAIVSNTINFQAQVTTSRDRRMSVWLKSKFTLPESLVHDMFADKSRLEGKIKDILASDFAPFPIANKSLGISQLEIINADKFITTNLAEIKVSLRELQSEQAANYTFLTCIDLEKGFNLFVCVNEKTRQLLTRILGLEFHDGLAKRSGIIMRKEILPLIKADLESRDGNIT